MSAGLEELLGEWDKKYNAQKGRNAKRAWPAGSPAAAREALAGIVNRVPQAVVKITGGGKSAKAIGAHLRYISRNGELELVDQDGQPHEGKEARHDILERWENAGLPGESQHREAFNIVLSPGKGTDGDALRRAAENFAREHFADNHEYVMALHTPETDPSFGKSEHPHVHLVVNVRGRNGRRLNPRKADLFAYRQGFARALREQGVPSIAVRREAIFNTRRKGEKQSTYNMKKRGAVPALAATARAQPDAVRKALAAEARANELYVDLVAALAKSSGAEDRQLAKALGDVLPQLRAPRVVQTPSRSRGR